MVQSRVLGGPRSSCSTEVFSDERCSNWQVAEHASVVGDCLFPEEIGLCSSLSGVFVLIGVHG